MRAQSTGRRRSGPGSPAETPRHRRTAAVSKKARLAQHATDGRHRRTVPCAQLDAPNSRSCCASVPFAPLVPRSPIPATLGASARPRLDKTGTPEFMQSPREHQLSVTVARNPKRPERNGRARAPLGTNRALQTLVEYLPVEYPNSMGGRGHQQAEDARQRESVQYRAERLVRRAQHLRGQCGKDRGFQRKRDLPLSPLPPSPLQCNPPT